MKTILAAAIAASISLAVLPHASGQTPGPPRPTGPANLLPPIDLTGYWVALVTEDWRLRMITPPKGDYSRVPLTEQARKIADAWEPAADEASGNQCKSYGGAAIMRLPTRFHITWQDDNTLRVESDFGMQTRLFRFNAPPSPPGDRTWQGNSAAQWQMPSSLKVTTTNLRSGYLRKNGVPYSENAVVTEYFDLAEHPSGGEVLLVTTIVDDPQYIQQPYVVTSQFKKEEDGSKWDPTPCTAK
ncbi:MAG TPA: hypothetical protein VLY24_03400 [Bryobacteraceae bacterium]|nr:hypothetical protein [Bryobacteraceae bacterium]